MAVIKRRILEDEARLEEGQPLPVEVELSDGSKLRFPSRDEAEAFDPSPREKVRMRELEVVDQEYEELGRWTTRKSAILCVAQNLGVSPPSEEEIAQFVEDFSGRPLEERIRFGVWDEETKERQAQERLLRDEPWERVKESL